MHDSMSKTNNVCITGVYGCILPKDWDGEWHDSSDTTQDITFPQSNNTVIGWSTTVPQFSSSVSSWTCVDYDPNNNLLLFQ